MVKDESKPLVWWTSESYPQKGYLKYNWKEERTDQYIFMRGHSVPKQNYDLIAQCGFEEKKLKKFDLLPGLVAPVVNQRAIEILSAVCPKDFQAFPITIINEPNISTYRNNDYFLINILHEIDSVDRERSYLRLREDEMKIRDIRKLIFKPGCMEKVHLAREKYFHPLLLVSPHLVQVLKKNKIKGGSFLTDIDSYNDSFPEEYLIRVFPDNPEWAKQYFVSKLNDKEEYTFFKTRIPKIPRDILESLIEMTLSRSSFHKEQCEEIREILNKEN